jgi:hypothetical protein
MLGAMGMQQIAGVQVFSVQVLSVQVLSMQALRLQIAPGGFRRGLDAGRSERNWYA